ncbi:MAG: phytanoyl-CoA dioxygenase family protein [Gammaproteobacteria bacterium]|nr:phytanoyl-CoA dioxygenase family protein [Gammaproteobacteria bacterium]
MALTQSEIEQYRRDGFTVPSYRLPAAQLAALREALDATLESNAGIRPEKLVSVHIKGRNAEGVVGHPTFLEVAKDPAILDRVQSVIGPHIILWGCQAFCKPGGDGQEVPMHQDGHYWPIRPLATCTVWIAIDDSTVENGCLRVLPRSHRDHTLFEHYTDRREQVTLSSAVMPGTVAQYDVVDVELEAGQMSLHDVYMVHGSNRNTSPRRRAGLAIRYMPATSHFNRDLIETRDTSGYLVDFSSRPLWLLRGRDQTGKNDFHIGH